MSPRPCADLDGDRLVYSTVEFDGATDQRRVYSLDLADRSAEAQRLDEGGRAAMPQILGDVVVGKDTDPEFHMLNAGTLARYSIANGTLETIDMGQRGELSIAGGSIRRGLGPGRHPSSTSTILRRGERSR